MHPEDKKNSARVLTVMQGVFLVMLLVFGVSIVHEGVRAIRDKVYTFRYTERTQAVLGGVILNTDVVNGELEFRGRAAVVFGTGFSAVGALLLVWAAGIVVNMLGRLGWKVPMAVVRLLGVLSLLTLLVGCVALLPPWRLHMLPLYLVVTAFILAVALPVPDEWREKVFPAAVILIFLVSYISFPAFPVFAGIFVALTIGVNLMVIWPGLGKYLGRKSAPAGRGAVTPPANRSSP
jgi:hypothetical protein